LNSIPPLWILRCVTNRLKDKTLVRSAWGVTVLFVVAARGGKSAPAQTPTPAPTAPLPTAGIASTRVPVLPLTLIAAEDSLGWQTVLGNRQAALAAADSVIGTLIRARSPEVNWVLPDELRREARRSPTFATNPDQMGTSLLRVEKLEMVPDPLRAELRTLVALADARYALVPAALIYRRSTGSADGRTATAELTVVLVDARLGRIGWRTVARGDGPDPWSALTRAVKALTPGLP
jgi:hypothetical protein